MYTRNVYDAFCIPFEGKNYTFVRLWMKRETVVILNWFCVPLLEYKSVNRTTIPCENSSKIRNSPMEKQRKNYNPFQWLHFISNIRSKVKFNPFFVLLSAIFDELSNQTNIKHCRSVYFPFTSVFLNWFNIKLIYL